MGTVLFDSFFNFQAGNRIGFGDVGADQKNHISGENVFVGDRPAMRSLYSPKGLNSIDLSKPGTTIQLIRPQDEPHELLKDVEIFVGTAGRNQTSNRIRTMRLFDANEFICHTFQRFLPRNLNPFPILTKPGSVKSIRMFTGM